ncbi:MAG: TIGR02996 domain-containing protein [Kofleriaceae bacterium]
MTRSLLEELELARERITYSDQWACEQLEFPGDFVPWDAVETYCGFPAGRGRTVPFFDGYILGELLTKTTGGGAFSFKTKAARDRYLKAAATRGSALLEGSLRELVVARTTQLFETDELVDATASAIAMGLALHHHVHGKSHPAIDPIVPQLAATTATIPSKAWASREARPLVDAVLADPSSDAPRLVFADWLNDRGDPRGELIALQLTRASGQQINVRERELLDTYGATWRKPASSMDAEIERGFIVSVDGRCTAYVANAAKLAREPLEFLHLVDMVAKKFTTLAPHPTLRTLTLRVPKLPISALAAPFLRTLVELRLDFSGIKDKGLAVLAKQPFTRLSVLTLEDTGITSKGVIALAAAPWMQRIERLVLKNNSAVDKSVLKVLAGLPLLTDLQITGVNVSAFSQRKRA